MTFVKKYRFSEHAIWFFNFNEPLEPYYEQIIKVSHLAFDYTIRQGSFNYPFIIMPSIRSIDFSVGFNQPIVITKSITKLDFPLDSEFNQPIILNRCIKTLLFRRNACFNQTLELNSNIQMLCVRGVFDRPIKLNSKMVHFVFGCKSTQQLEMPKRMFSLSIGSGYNARVKLGKYLKKLWIGKNNNCPIILNSHLLFLTLENDCGVNCILDCVTNTHVIMSTNNAYIYDNIPNGMCNLSIGEKVSLCLNNMPSDYKHN